MIQLKQLDIQDIGQMVKRLGSSYSSSDNMESFSQDPVHVSLYQQMMQFKKEELEIISISNDYTSSFFNSVLSYRSYLAFAALMEKRCFTEHLGPFSRWCLDNLTNGKNDFELYEFIYHNSENRYGNVSIKELKQKDHLSVNKQLELLDKYYLSKLEPEECSKSIEKTYQYFKTNNLEEINQFCFDNLINEKYRFNNDKPITINNRVIQFIDLMKKDNFNMNQTSLMNKILPDDQNYRDKDSFFISAAHFPEMTEKFKVGYRFNENDYTYNGKTLLETILLLGGPKENIRYITLMGEYFSRIEPLTITLAEQNVLIEQYSHRADCEEFVSNYIALVTEHFGKKLPEKEQKLKKKI